MVTGNPPLSCFLPILPSLRMFSPPPPGESSVRQWFPSLQSVPPFANCLSPLASASTMDLDSSAAESVFLQYPPLV
ncbi:unnamed protein product [Linum trigynum]|uniref:Uncharacterized protein n=1 Tax=Linum trigynum TaxID=586398 RepID=A0AAV2EA21_9ROSI